MQLQQLAADLHVLNEIDLTSTRSLMSTTANAFVPSQSNGNEWERLAMRCTCASGNDAGRGAAAPMPVPVEAGNAVMSGTPVSTGLPASPCSAAIAPACLAGSASAWSGACDDSGTC